MPILPFYQPESGTLSSNRIDPSALNRSGYSTTNETNNTYSKLMIRSKNKRHSFNKSFNSFGNYDTSVNLSRTKSILTYHKQQTNRNDLRYINPVIEIGSMKPIINFEVNENKKRKRRRQNNKICSPSSICSFFAATIGILLFLAGIASLLVFAFANKQITTIKTTMTSTS